MSAVPQPNISDCFKPLWMVSKILGMDPYEISVRALGNGRVKLELMLSKRALVYVTSGILTRIVIYVYFVFVLIHHANYLAMIPAVYITFIISTSCLFITSLAGTVSMWLYKTPRQEMLQLYEEIDAVLIDDAGNCYKKWQKRTIIGIFLMFVTMSLTSGINLFKFVHQQNARTFSEICFNIIDFLNLVMISNYTNTLLLARQRYNILNQKLRSECEVMSTTKIRRESAARYGIPLFIEELPQQVRSPEFARNTRIAFVEAGSSRGNRYSEAKMITSFRIVHNKLYKISALINSAHGVSMMLGVLTCFLCFISTSHRTLLFASKSFLLADPGVGVAEMVNMFGWWALYSAEAAAVSWVCSSTAREARETMHAIGDILALPGVDEDASDQLKEFFLQASRRKTHFSGGGFIVLDLPLLASMCVSATSYVLVLLQLYTDKV
ncbi:hypothetical protein PR048_008035 [Dryococelus australis]|uniref:Gustatory receptor n=1 Tax=Dryococelus australis TaxID=614101 RepID=A0ABQ9HVY3_9NEOP|nr:hypothetical protein PR048_008035 [Dryococelus australis]